MLVICSLERKKECKFENSIVTLYYKPMCFYHVFIIWSVVCVSKRNNFTMFFIIWSVVCVNKRRKLWWNMVENLGQSWNHSIEHKRLNMMMIEGNKLHAYLVICNRPNYIAPKAMHSLTDKPPAQEILPMKYISSLVNNLMGRVVCRELSSKRIDCEGKKFTYSSSPLFQLWGSLIWSEWTSAAPSTNHHIAWWMMVFGKENTFAWYSYPIANHGGLAFGVCY